MIQRENILSSRRAIAGVLLLCCGSTVARAEHVERPGVTAPVRDGRYQFARHVTSWRKLQRQNVVMQRRDFSCGAAALATLVRYYWGDEVTEELFLRKLDQLLTADEARDRIENGLSLTDLRRVAVKTGYLASLGKLTLAKLVQSKVPVILGISVDGYDHFVVYRGWDGEWIYLADPIRGNVRVHVTEFAKQWQANAILAVVKRGEKPKQVSALSLRLDETRAGALNWQLVRSRAVKSPLP